MAASYECSSRLVLPGFQPGTTLYRYEGEMRNLILAAKVTNRYAALVKLSKLVLADPRIPELMHWCQGIVVAPSSFWGRLRGRYDVVAFLAAKLTKKFCKPVASFEMPVLWRRNKRAIEKSRNSKAKSNEGPRCLICQEGLTRWVLFDDVSTTGFTLMNFLPFLKNLECRPLVIAGANKVFEIPSGSSIKSNEFPYSRSGK